MKTGQIFPSKVCHFQYSHRFLSCIEMGNIRTCNEVRLQKHVKSRLPGYYSLWNFSICLKTKNRLGRVSPSHFLQNFLKEISKICIKNF